MNPDKEKFAEFIVDWRRWTIGVHWENLKSEYAVGFRERRLEISIQVPVVALSLVLVSYKPLPEEQ